MDQYAEDYCFAAFVANTWNTPAHISVDFNGTSLAPSPPSRASPAGAGPSLTYARLRSDQRPAAGASGHPLPRRASAGTGVPCPVPPPRCPRARSSSRPAASALVPHHHRRARGRLRDQPLRRRQRRRHRGLAAAPRRASWDMNYVAVTVSPQDIYGPVDEHHRLEDNTTSPCSPRSRSVGGGRLPAGAANTPYTFTLNTGEMAQFTQAADLTGQHHPGRPAHRLHGRAAVHARAAGVGLLRPRRADGAAREGARAASTSAVMYRPRVTGDEAIWHLVGAVDGTTLTYSDRRRRPRHPRRRPGRRLHHGHALRRPEPGRGHPFMLFAYMTGSQWSCSATTAATATPTSSSACRRSST